MYEQKYSSDAVEELIKERDSLIAEIGILREVIKSYEDMEIRKKIARLLLGEE